MYIIHTTQNSFGSLLGHKMMIRKCMSVLSDAGNSLNIIAQLLRSPHNGFPPNNSVRTPPSAYTSHVVPSSSDFSCSGDWNPGVPAILVAVPNARVVTSFPNPKSAKYT